MKTIMQLLVLAILAGCYAPSARAQIITTFAGNGESRIDTIANGAPATACVISAYGIAIDESGNIYMASKGPLVYKVNKYGVLFTVAGNAGPGYSGDGGQATDAKLEANGIAVDKNNNIFISDINSHVIRKINSGGIISTIAGIGTAGYSGDNGPATAAKLNWPWGVAVDGIGNVFIAEGFNNRIRKVDTLGIITTFAGNGVSGYSGDGGPATAAKIAEPWGVAVNAAGNVFIYDGNASIRMVDASGIIRRIAGNGSTAGYSGDGGPATAAQISSGFSGLSFDRLGNLYIADAPNQRIRMVDTLGIISTVAGNGYINNIGMGTFYGGYSGDGGVATNAELNWPSGVVVDSGGNIYIADQYNGRIRKVSSGNLLSATPIKAQNQIEIYPNPSSGTINIFSLGAYQEATVTIKDITGKTIYNVQLPANAGVNESFDLSDIVPGLYVVSLNKDGHFYHEKIVLR